MLYPIAFSFILALLCNCIHPLICSCLWHWYQSSYVKMRSGTHLTNCILVKIEVKPGLVISPALSEQLLEIFRLSLLSGSFILVISLISDNSSAS